MATDNEGGFETGGIPELEFVEYVSHVVRSRVLRYSTRESCIITARLVCQTLNCLGIRAQPLTVGVRNMNAYTHEHVMLQNLPDDPDDDDLFIVGIEHKYTPEDEPWGDSPWWSGHLGVLVDNRFFTDPSCDQMSWPEKGVDLSPFAVHLPDPDDFLYNGLTLRLTDDNNGQVSYYDAFLDDLAYMRSSDWSETKKGQPYYEAVIPGAVDLLETCKAMGTLPGKPPLPETISMRSDREITREQIDNARAGFDSLAEVARQLGKDLGPAVQSAKEWLVQCEQQLAQAQEQRAQDASQPSSP